MNSSTAVRPLEPVELLLSAELNTARLIRGVGEMDAGRPEAVIEVASALRQLVGHGKGNHLLQRVVGSGERSAEPIGEVGKGVQSRAEPRTRFELAGFPLDVVPASSDNHPSLARFLGIRCLRVISPRLNEEVVYTWDDLISVVANKLGGVHTDAERREILDDLACYLIGSVPALRYALRTVGAAICSLAVRLLDPSLTRRWDPLPPLYSPAHIELFSAHVVGGLDEKALEITAGIRHRQGRAGSIVGWVERGDPAWLFRPPSDWAPSVVRRSTLPAARNDPCPCGSGRKHKKCCGA